MDGRLELNEPGRSEPRLSEARLSTVAEGLRLDMVVVVGRKEEMGRLGIRLEQI